MLLTEFDEKLYKKTVYNEGYEDGMNEGHKRGVNEGFERGVSKGFENGHKRGILETREQDIKSSIMMLRRLNLSDEEIASLIAENYAVSKEAVIKEICQIPDGNRQ